MKNAHVGSQVRDLLATPNPDDGADRSDDSIWSSLAAGHDDDIVVSAVTTRGEDAVADASPARDGLPTPRRYLAIAAISLGTMVSSIDNGSITIALPTLARDLHVAPSAAVTLVTVYQLVIMVAILPMSALGDRIGHRTLYQYGQLFFAAATALCFVVDTLPALLAVRAVQALGAAAGVGVVSAMVRSIYPRSRLGQGISLNTVVATASASFAPVIGGVVLSMASWQWLFATSIPFALVSILCGRAALPDPAPSVRPFDWQGSAMCAILFACALGGVQSGLHGGPVAITVLLLLVAAGVGIIFVRGERDKPSPVLPVDLLRRRDIGFGSLGSTVSAMASITLLLSLPFRLQQAYGYSPAESGIVLAPWPLVMMLVAPGVGYLSDRVAAGWLGMGGMAISVVGLISLALLPADPSHADVMWRVTIAAVGFSFYASPIARHIIASVPIERAAAAGALTQATRLTGLVLGSTGFASLLAAGIGTGPAPAILAAVLALVAGLLCFGLVGAPDAKGA